MAQLAAYNFDEASGDILDRSGNGRTITFTGNNLARVTGLNSTTALQQTTTAFSTGPSITGLQTTNRTVMMWLRINAGFTGWVMEYYRSTSQGSPNDTGIWGILFLSGTLRWRAKNASNTAFDVSFPADTGNWHHIAATHDGDTLRLYRDGSLHGSQDMNAAVWAGADVWRVFDQVGTAATIEDVRIYDEVLDATAITSLMNTPVSSANTVTGTAAAALTLSAAVAGSRTVLGTALATLVLDSSETGQRTVLADATADQTLTASATGLRTALGLATAELDMSATVAGSRTVLGSALAAPVLTAAAAGVAGDGGATVLGTASASLALSAVAGGVRGVSGQMAAPMALSAAVAGRRGVLGTAGFAGVLTAHAAGRVPGQITLRPNTGRTIRPDTGITERP